MDRGLWSWSRHPNYFGEFSFWFAMALFGVAAAPADAWWLFVGAVIMLALFLFASIPMMEERSVARRPEYQAGDRPGVTLRAVATQEEAAVVIRKRVVIAGLGDSGVLTAIRLGGRPPTSTWSASRPSPRW